MLQEQCNNIPRTSQESLEQMTITFHHSETTILCCKVVNFIIAAVSNILLRKYLKLHKSFLGEFMCKMFGLSIVAKLIKFVLWQHEIIVSCQDFA